MQKKSQSIPWRNSLSVKKFHHFLLPIHYIKTYLLLSSPAMASSATFSISFSPSFTLSRRNVRPFLSRTAFSVRVRPISIKSSSTSLDHSTLSVAGTEPSIPIKVRLFLFITFLYLTDFNYLKIQILLNSG